MPRIDAAIERGRRDKLSKGARPGSQSRLEGREDIPDGTCGAIAQLGERFNGIEEVVGSIPSGSTIPPLTSPFR